MTAFVKQGLGTLAVWALSGGLALALAVMLTTLWLSRRRGLRACGSILTTVTRGVPTSLLVVAAGIAALPHAAPTWLPNPFPGTSPRLAGVAWAVTIALCLGSAGHLAVILRSGHASIGTARLEQVMLLGLTPVRRIRLLAREAAGPTLAPLGSRLVHHLHNTAFAALFPVAELFGWVQEQANDTFDVTRYVGIGVATYVVLSLAIWATFRGLEYYLAAGPTATRQPVLSAVAS